MNVLVVLVGHLLLDGLIEHGQLDVRKGVWVVLMVQTQFENGLGKLIRKRQKKNTIHLDTKKTVSVLP